MAGITGMGDTFDLPNFHGPLFGLSPEDTPLLSAIGGLTGGEHVLAKEFEWQGYDLREPAQNVALEGATAPTAQARVRQNFGNVVQVVHSKVSTSYTKQAAVGHFASTAAPINGENPVTDEHDWQLTQEIKQIARDVNWTFINGQYAKPADNNSPRKTRGLMQAISAANTVDKGTNVATGASSATTEGGTALTLGTSTANIDYHSVGTTAADVDDINEFAQLVYDGGGLDEGLGTFLVNSSQKLAITSAYANAYGKGVLVTKDSNVAGVAVTQLDTDFGRLNIMLDRAVPQDAIILTSLNQLKPKFLLIPGKGSFFEEPLAKTGASFDSQLYGEIGFEYGSPITHGVIRGLPFRGQ